MKHLILASLLILGLATGSDAGNARRRPRVAPAQAVLVVPVRVHAQRPAAPRPQRRPLLRRIFR